MEQNVATTKLLHFVLYSVLFYILLNILLLFKKKLKFRIIFELRSKFEKRRHSDRRPRQQPNLGQHRRVGNTGQYTRSRPRTFTEKYSCLDYERF